MKKRNIIFGFIASLILLLSYILGSYRFFTEEYLKNIKYMNISYKMTYIAIIPIILLIIYFLIMLTKKKNTRLTKVLMITVVIVNILIEIMAGINLYNLISVIFNILLLVYLIKVWFIHKIPLNNKIIIIAFGIIIFTSIIGNVYSIIDFMRHADLMSLSVSNSFIIALFSSVLSQIAYILLAFYYNNLYSESNI